jgi:hypothetical protein
MEQELYEDENKLSPNHFIIMWCSEGLECVVPYDQSKLDDGAFMLAKLEGNENKYAKELNRQLFFMNLRARANTQRHYEIYALETSGGITKETIENMFEETPQIIVDLIREKGRKVFSDRANQSPRII